MRLPHVLTGLLALATLIGCGVDRNYRYTFHKSQISQEQLLRDQAALREVNGVIAASSASHHDGSGSIEVEVEEGHDIEIQQRLMSMGYTKGQH